MKNELFAACSLSALIISGFWSSNRPGGALAADPQTPQVIEEFDIAKGGDLILVPVTIGREQYPFLLGTNCDRTIVDVRLRHLLGKSLGEMEGNEELAHWEEFAPIPMKIGKLEFTASKPVQCADIFPSLVRERIGHAPYGVVGLDFLRDRVIHIDFDNGKLRVLTAVPNNDYKPKADPKTMLAEDTREFPKIVQRIDGYGWSCFVVDTSLTGPAIVRPRLMAELIEKSVVTNLREGPCEVTFDGRQTRHRTGRLRGLAPMGREFVRDIPVLKGEFGRVGLGYLSRFELTLDFKNGKLYMVPGANFDAPYPDNWTGMIVVLKEGELTVAEVQPKGPAEQAGIRASDVLLELNGTPAATFSLFQIRKLLSEAGPHPMTFRREGREVVLELTRPKNDELNNALPDVDDNVIETFEVARHGDALLLPISIGRAQHRFIVDTGTTSTVMDKTLKSQFTKTGRRTLANGRISLSIYSTDSLFIGKSRLPGACEVVCIDLSAFREASGHDFTGILGLDILKAQVVEINFDTGRLSILKSVPESAGTEFQLQFDRIAPPLLKMRLAGDRTIPFLVDTRLSVSGILRHDVFDALCEQGQIKLCPTLGQSETVIGKIEFRQGWLNELSLGNVVHSRILVSEGSEHAIGLEFLSRYIATFDFPRDRLYLKPGKRIAEPDRIDLSGMHVVRAADVIRVRGVDDGSLAAMAGLQAGDRILKVDGNDASTFSLFEIRAMLATEGLRMRLDVDGSSGRREVDLLLPQEKSASSER